MDIVQYWKKIAACAEYNNEMRVSGQGIQGIHGVFRGFQEVFRQGIQGIQGVLRVFRPLILGFSAGNSCDTSPRVSLRLSTLKDLMLVTN